MLSLRCLLNVQVELSNSSWIIMAGVQEGGWFGDINLGVRSLWVVFKAIRQDKVT